VNHSGPEKDVIDNEEKETPLTQESYLVATNPNMLGKHEEWLHVLFAGESQTKSGHQLGPKVYDFYLMHIVLSGKGVFITENGRYELQAGDTFLIKPNALISYIADEEEPWFYRWVAFRGLEAERVVQMAGFTRGQEIFVNEQIDEVSKLFKDIITTFREGKSTSSLHALGIVLLIMNEYGRRIVNHSSQMIPSRTNEDLLQHQIIHYLSSQYAQPLSIEQMAEAFGYNRAYLSRIFKRKTGLSPSTFLLQLRLDKARHLLRERTDLTIEQVAASVGMQDALYFSKQFKKQYKQSPTTYRKIYIEQFT